MLDIYAQTLMTATRSDKLALREVPPTNMSKRRRWFSRRKTIYVSPSEL